MHAEGVFLFFFFNSIESSAEGVLRTPSTSLVTLYDIVARTDSVFVSAISRSWYVCCPILNKWLCFSHTCIEAPQNPATGHGFTQQYPSTKRTYVSFRVQLAKGGCHIAHPVVRTPNPSRESSPLKLKLSDTRLKSEEGMSFDEVVISLIQP